MLDLKKGKTALEDNASIYQKQEEKTERQKWRDLDRKQKKQYFIDYYLGRTLGTLVLVFAALFLVWHFAKPKEETVLYVAVIDESLEEHSLAAMTEELEELLGADGKRQKVLIDDSFYLRDKGMEKLEVYLYSGQIDVIIAGEDTWRTLAGYGFLKDLEDPSAGRNGRMEEDSSRDSLCYAPGYGDSEEVSFEDRETGQGERKAYGISLKGSKRLEEMSRYLKDPVFSLAESSKHTENAWKFLSYLREEPS